MVAMVPLSRAEPRAVYPFQEAMLGSAPCSGSHRVHSSLVTTNINISLESTNRRARETIRLEACICRPQNS